MRWCVVVPLPALLLLLPLFRADSSDLPPCFDGGALPSLEGVWREAPDDQSLEPPPYWDMSCPFEMGHYSCVHHGDGRSHAAQAALSRRLRYAPHNCSLPRFEGDAFARLLREGGRHVEFFGDSVTRQHFISLTCQLLPAVDWRETMRFWANNHPDVKTGSPSAR